MRCYERTLSRTRQMAPLCSVYARTSLHLPPPPHGDMPQIPPPRWQGRDTIALCERNTPELSELLPATFPPFPLTRTLASSHQYEFFRRDLNFFHRIVKAANLIFLVFSGLVTEVWRLWTGPTLGVRRYSSRRNS